MARKFNEQEEIRRSKLAKLKADNQNPFASYKIERTDSTETLKTKFKQYNREELEKLKQDNVTLAGRVRTIRLQGKAGFATIQDQNGQIQIYVREDIVGADLFAVFKNLDLGDFIFIVGTVMKTKLEELTVRVKTLKLISKVLKVLPEKYHGLTDIEERYRRRYLDLIFNPEIKEIFIDRTKIFQLIRNYLNNLGFLEVETPILHSILGGAAAKPFITYHNAIGHNFYLRIATELHLKRLIVGGFEKVYEIGRLFRNEGISPRHNPEFTTIELYQAYGYMETMMELTENLINYLVDEIVGKRDIEYGGNKISFKSPWKRVTMVDAIKDAIGINFYEINDFKIARNLAEKHNLKLEQHHTTVGHIINLFFENFVEDKLIQPTFVYEYPTVISPLAKANEKDDRFADRFELFIGAREYANAYSELNDPVVQEQRFEEQLRERDLGNEEANEMDLDFIEALEYGMPPTGGLGIGLDRLVMLLKNQNSIKDVLLFPHMGPRNKPKDE